MGEKHSGHGVTRTFTPALLFEVGVPMRTQILVLMDSRERVTWLHHQGPQRPEPAA